MKSTVSYIKHYFRKVSGWYLVLLGLSLIWVGLNLDKKLKYYDVFSEGMYYFSGILYSFALIVLLIPIASAIVSLFSLYHRRNLDTLWSLPIDRRKVCAVHFFGGAFAQTIIFWSCFLLWAIVTEANFAGEYDFFIFLSTGVYLWIYSLILYSVSSFIIGRANHILDGFAFLGLWILLFVIFVAIDDIGVKEIVPNGISNFFERNDRFFDYTISPITNIERLIGYEQAQWIIYGDQFFVGSDMIFSFNPLDNPYFVRGFFLWIVLGIWAAIGHLWSFSKKKVERIGEISNSIWGYKVMIPLIAVTLTALDAQDSLALNVITMVGAILCYMIYRRSWRLKRSDLIVLGCLLVFALIMQIPVRQVAICTF